MALVRILICVPVHNRVAIARQCIPTLRASMYAGDHLAIYDDGSTEDVRPLLTHAENESHHARFNVGVDAQRREHILDFKRGSDEFTHLYFSDADAFVDPHWRSRLLDIQARTGLLTCGYHTQVHEDYAKNVFDRKDGVVFTRFAPGISYLMTREMVEKIASVMPEKWSFDWHIPSILGHKCAVSDVSCVDHISSGGMHHDGTMGYDGGDRALNPTGWLMDKRAEIVAKLEAGLP